VFLFIFESIGTSELLLVGIVALIFLGPRRLPEMARKFGKIMAEFRGTANEFKETWAREANFEEEAKLLNINAIEAETVARAEQSDGATPDVVEPIAPTIKDVDPAAMEQLKRQAEHATDISIATEAASADPNDKKNGL
jgi:sec-independent protein translocase protein TatB